MPAISLLIKPVSGRCNMRCEYCFYQDVTSQRETADYGMMTYETLELIVKKAFEYASSGMLGGVTFGFQGGEPTLAGIDFYKRLIELQEKYNSKRLPVQNSIQTNGLMMSDEWGEFLHKHKFLVGLSLDGTREVHDKYRHDASGNGTYERVVGAAKLMDYHKVEYNILSTVNIDVAKNIEKIYYNFKKLKFNYLQFIPCLDGYDCEKKGYSLTAEAYGEFLKKLFTLWSVDLAKGAPISIRYFDNLVMMLGGYPPESCGMAGVCSCYYMIEADGSVYPCDFYVTDEWRLGSLVESEFAELHQTKAAKEFVDISRQEAVECASCRHRAICRGGCRRNREPISMGQPTRNQLCSSFLTFFDFAKQDLQKIADKYLKKTQ